MNKDKKKTILAVAIPLVILAIVTPIAYLMITKYVKEKKLVEDFETFTASPTAFYPGSSLNGIDITGMTPKEAAQEIEKEFDSRYIRIESDRIGEHEKFYFSSINADFENFEAYVEDIFEKQTYSLEEYSGATKPAAKLYSYDLTEDVSFNNADYSGIACINETTQEAPADAYVYLDIDTGETSIVPEVYGTLADRKTVVSKLIDAFFAGSDTVVIEDSDYLSPEVTSEDPILVETEDYYHTLLNKTLDIRVCGLSESFDSDAIRDYLIFSDTHIAVDRDKLGKYVDGLKERYDSYNKEYTFVNSFGETVYLDYGNYGWLIDREGTIDKISAGILENSPESTSKCSYTHTCARAAGNLQGNSYMEVSLAHQKVWFYLNGELIVYDDCTTGEIGQGEINTYPGFFHVYEKKTEVTLKGPTWEDFVHYWVLFDEAHADGFHDATWREEWEFGGENRNGNGSHGCVNLRLNTAAIIYEKLTEDMPIIIW